MSVLGGVRKAFIPWESAVKSTDAFNDNIGSRESSLGRIVTGGLQAYAYGSASYEVGKNAVESFQKLGTAMPDHPGDAIGFGILGLAQGAATTMLATHAVASVVTAVNAQAANGREDKI